MRISQGKGEVEKRGSLEDLLHLPNRARRDLATTFHRLSKHERDVATCEQAPRATKQVRAVRPS